jgi:hypothetical protein
MKSRKGRMWSGALVLIVAVGVTASSSTRALADATPSGPEEESTTTVISALEIARAADDRSMVDERGEAEDALLGQSADNGVLYDAAEVASSVVDDASVAWTDNVVIENVVIAGRENLDAEAAAEPAGSADDLGLGLEAESSPGAADTAVANLGSSQLTGVEGRWGDHTRGTVQVAVGNYRIISGWERYRVPESKTDRDIYYYGHWITAYGEDVRGSWDHSPKLLDIRSRPKRGYLKQFMQVRDYWPKVSNPKCSPTGDLSVSVGAVGVSLPMQNCSSLDPDLDLSTFTSRVVWNAGLCNDNRVEGADLGVVVDVKPGKVAVLSDYSYAQFSSAGKCDQYAGDNTRVIYSDPGW